MFFILDKLSKDFPAMDDRNPSPLACACCFPLVRGVTRISPPSCRFWEVCTATVLPIERPKIIIFEIGKCNFSVA